MIDDFNSWVKRAISEHGINSDADYFFMDALVSVGSTISVNFDKRAVFISEIALHDFVESHKTNMRDAKELLKTHGVFDQKHYQIITSTQAYEGFRASISFDCKVDNGINAEIQEVTR